MKGLFLAFGLIAALFISNNVQASIYDTATYQAPKIESITTYACTNNSNNTQQRLTIDACASYHQSLIPSDTASQTYTDCKYIVFTSSANFSCQINGKTSSGWTSLGRTTLGVRSSSVTNNTSSCPPDQFPNYSFGRDTNNDGKTDQCYDPRELDNASKCSDLFNSGSILTVGSNTAPLVCKTFEDGSRCAFSRVNQGSTPYYQPNLEVGCFGDGNEIPDYDKDANQPQPDTDKCVPYAEGYACSADPNQYCSVDHRCVDGCGYVNDQFICFRDQQCTGASCEPAPINCENSPDAPVCKDKQTTPEPSFCEKNPTVQSCQSGSDFCKQNPLAPSCQLGGTGGGGGSEFSLDYEKLINGMKDAVKLIIDPSETPEFSEFKSEIDDKTSELDSDIDGFMNGSHFDGINDQISENPFSGQFQLPSGGGCTAFELGGHSLDLCSVAQKISSILYFVFAFLTMLHLKNLFFLTVTPRKE